MAAKNVEIRAFERTEWQLYKHTRLRALKDSPDAFGSTIEQAMTIPDADWENRIVNVDRDNNFPVAAFIKSDVSGMAWVKLEDDIAYLFQMWVSPDFRGVGVGSEILRSAVSWASGKGASVMRLGVTLGDSPAGRMYQSAGFIVTGELEPLREGSEMQVQTMEYTFGGGV